MTSRNCTDRQKLTEALCEVKEWLETQPHMPQCASEDEDLLEAFIKGFSPYLSLTKLKLDAYYSFRGMFNQPYFYNRDPKKIKWYSVMKYIILEERTPEGDYVLLALPPKKEQRHYYSADESRKLLLMLLDSFIREHRETKMSLYLVIDAENITKELVNKHADFSSFNLILETYPMKIKKVIYFNTTEVNMGLCDELLKEFCTEGTHIQSDMERGPDSLTKYLPLEIIPSDYQGNNLPVKALWDGVQQRLERERDWFLSNGSQTTCESLRS